MTIKLICCLAALNLALLIGLRAEQPTVNVTSSDQSLTLRWAPAGGTLQAGSFLGGNSIEWSDLGPTNPLRIPIGNGSQLFRVKVQSSTGNPGTILSAKSFGAAGDGLNDDTEALQNGLSQIARNGGGIFYIPAGTYIVTNTVLIGNGTQVYGGGRGITILKEKTVEGRLGRVVNGAQVYATLAMVGVTNASVLSLTIDHRESTNAMNGIALMPDGENLSGTISTGCTVRDCEVYGRPGQHTYLIWSMRAEQVHILNNVCNGGTLPSADLDGGQEGIEVFGGRQVWVVGNMVKGISNRGINIGNSPGNGQVAVDTVWVADNYVTDCKIGAYVNASYDSVHQAQNTSNVNILNNRFENLWLYGITAYMFENTALKNIVISGNTISNVVGPDSTGIELYGYGRSQGSPIYIDGVTVDHNRIECVTNTTTTSAPIHLSFWQNTTIENNFVSGGTGQGIEVSNVSTNITVRGNTIEDSWRSAILLQGANDCSIVGNRILRYNQSAIGSAGILVITCTNLIVSGNQFQSNLTAESRALQTSADCDRIAVFGNPWLSPTTVDEPFNNLGSNPNRASFLVEPGLMSTVVTNSLINQAVSVRVSQLSGTVMAGFLVTKGTPNSGAFTISFESTTVGDEAFEYELVF